MRLPRRLQLLLAGFLAVVVVAVGVDVAVLRVRDDASDRLHDRLEPSKLLLQTLLTALVDQETGQRGFLLTADEEFLVPFERGRVEADAALDEMRSLLAGDDDLLAALQRIQSAVAAWRDLGADFEITARREGGLDVTEELVGTGTSRRMFDTIRTQIADTADLLEDQVVDQRRRVDRLDTMLVWVDAGTLLASAVLVLLADVLTRRWITDPLDDLTTSVRRVAAGALRSSIVVEGPPDLTSLGADVDAMRRRVLAEVEAAERAREALAERGMVVLTLRDELAAGNVPLPPGVSLAGRFAPAQGIVAGDWFDVIRLPDDRVAVALVDVSGHGAGVGAFALKTKALTLAAVQGHEPGDAFGWLRERLGDTGEQFLTGVIAVLDAATGVVRYASAGHPPLLLGGLTGVSELGPTGPLLGPIDATWETREVTLDRGGVLVAFSDGLIEARDERSAPFGLRALIEIVERMQLNGADAVADACMDAVHDHQATREDDLTLVVLAR